MSIIKTIKKKPILSFVIREGRMTPGQKVAFDKYWLEYGLECPDQIAPLNFSDMLGTAQPITLEIGFGMGASLLQQAIDSPHKHFIGIEVHRPGVGKLLKEAVAHEVKNLHIFNHNAIEVLTNAIADHSLACVQLFFPDPWPKARHHKRRIVQPDFVKLIAQKLQPGGIFHMATDWADYADHMRAVMGQSSDFRIASLIEAQSIKRPKTKFENRGQALGHVISDLVYFSK